MQKKEPARKLPPDVMGTGTYNIEKIVGGGDGLARDRAGVIFVPYSLPGEKVELRLLPARKGPRRAAISRIVEPSQSRVQPNCPLYGRCGGCSLQHAEYSLQLEIKKSILAETMARIAKIEIEPEACVPSPLAYGYRSRVRLAAEKGKVGYYSRGKEKLVPLDECALAVEQINRVIPLIKGLLGTVRASSAEPILREDGKVLLHLSGRGEERNYLFRPGEAGAAGPDWIRTDLVPTFTQVNPGQNENLKRMVGRAAEETGASEVLELFAGSGNLTGRLARRGVKVTAVESDPAAAELGRRRFSGSSEARVDFVNAPAREYLAEVRDKARPDLVVLDPPRLGAKEEVALLSEIKPPHILYISCDPATLARDLAILAAAGYGLESLTPLDMFAQTAHIECVARLYL